jgi:hypothetical protein
MKHRYSQGPWSVSEDYAFVFIRDANRDIVGYITRGPHSIKESGQDMWDAHLMAAAPELLAALLFVMSAQGEELDLAYQQAGDAIQKALQGKS